MGWSIAFIVVFGIAIIIPAAWSIIGLIRGNKKFWPGVAGTCFGVALLLVTFIGAATNWGDCPVVGGTAKGAVKCARGDNETDCKPDVWKLECGQTPGCSGIPPRAFCPPGQKPVFPFCERIQRGGVKQPWATWSDLSFVAAGLWLLWFFQYWPSGATSITADNPMKAIGWLSVTYGMIAIFMGPPSQWFHASMKEWGGWFDSMSVVIWLMFNAIYVLYALIFSMRDKWRGIERTIIVLCVWGGLVIILGLVAINPDARLINYFISGGLWGLAEVAYVIVGACCKSYVVYRRTWWLFVINLVLLAVTMTIWIFFNDGIVPPTWCQEHEVFPGHAIFHILASFSTILTFASFASERRV